MSRQKKTAGKKAFLRENSIFFQFFGKQKVSKVLCRDLKIRGRFGTKIQIFAKLGLLGFFGQELDIYASHKKYGTKVYKEL